MEYAQEKQVAIAAVVAAAKLCEQVRNNCRAAVIQKQDRSPVTIADFGAQALICQAIAATFCQDSIVGEESAAMLRQPEMAPQLQKVTQQVKNLLPNATTDAVLDWIDRGTGQVSDRYWTLDPIDGTKGFVRGDQYAIALALIEDGAIKLGVMACPALSLHRPPPEADQGVVFVAVQGTGATQISLKTGKTQPIRVAHPKVLENLRVIESVELDHGNPALQRAIAQTVGISAPPLSMDSQAKYGVVASGQAALYMRLRWASEPEYQENIWDHAAGAIVVQEAGGRVTDMDGKPLDFSTGIKLTQNRGIVASNGVLHEAVVEALQKVDK
ncbi:MAG: 3'(2'),5'-bisphosphate nucleotidase [Scytolyngbya sp. HA4215-MV1]|nr:3'(2'),5'-bisphosphate nucleotidase [Scytolyngbya sp. HA4215-MV1]